MKAVLIVFIVLAGIASLFSLTVAVVDFIHTIQDRKATKNKNSTNGEK